MNKKKVPVTPAEKLEKVADYYWLNKRNADFRARRAEIRRRSYQKKRDIFEQLQKENKLLKEDNKKLLDIIDDMEKLIAELQDDE
jgi:predicted nuclease with TOPRIM domain